MTVRYTKRAQRDLKVIVEFVERENPKAAELLRHAIRRTAILVSERPHIGKGTSGHLIAEAFS